MSIADKLTTIAENVPKVHEAGKQAGQREWMDKYRKAGGQYATRYCMGMFAGWGWTNETFNPIYDIKVANAQYMFFYSGITANISKLCEEKGITLDFSSCTGFSGTFMHSSISGIDTIDTRNCTDLSSIFANAKSMVEINDLILKDDGSQTFGNSSFSNCTSLVILKITGVIGTTVPIRHSPLNRASIENVVNCLSSTATKQTLTLNLAAVNKAFETSEGANNGSVSMEWLDLESSKPNWTIALA